jgi:hypothetical protein
MYDEMMDSREGWTEAEEMEYNEYLDSHDWGMDEYDEDCECEEDPSYDGQPTEYEEWQDYMGGDDWDFGQYDEY